MDTQLARWGNSLAVRIPKDVAEKARFREGDPVRLYVGEGGGVVIEPVQGQITLESLVDGITPENRHAETEWGPARGKESW